LDLLRQFAIACVGVPPLYNILISKYIFAPAGSGCPLYSRLTKTTAKKPYFSKSGDAASILHASDCMLGDFCGLNNEEDFIS
jgi:hypothetical protein